LPYKTSAIVARYFFGCNREEAIGALLQLNGDPASSAEKPYYYAQYY